jgi:type IVB pilus formation R64 PilN family outer membrane protein
MVFDNGLWKPSVSPLVVSAVAVLPLANRTSKSSLGWRWSTCALVISACLSLAACDQSEKTRKIIDQRAGESQQSLDTAAKVSRPVIYDPLTVSNKVWSGNTALRMQRGMPLPTRYETPHGVTLVSADPMSLSDIANAISAQTGIPIRLTALSVGGGAKAASAASATGATASGFTPAASSSTASAAAAPSGDATMPVSYEGPLSGLLERISANFGINWRYDGSSISISRYETRIFAVEALPGTQQVNEGMQDDQGGSSSGGASGGAGGGGSSSSSNSLTQNSKFTMDFKYWEELSQVLNSILGGQGSVVVSPSMGTVTITTTPDVMTTVSDYLGKENKRLSRQIAINVQIYQVSLQSGEDFNVSFNAFLKNLAHVPGLSFDSAAGASASTTGMGVLNVGILNNNSAQNVYAGDVLTALSTIGDASSVAQFPMTTLNNRPVSRRVGTDTTYVQSVTSGTTSSSASTSTSATTATPGTVHQGFSLQLTPRLLDDGRILMQYSLSLIGLTAINEFNTAVGACGNVNLTTGQTTGTCNTAAAQLGSTISLPQTTNRIFVQQSMLRSGSTLIIGGVDDEELGQNKNGVGSPDNLLLGGGTSTTNTRLMMIMAITPQVMDVPGNGEHG